MLLIPNSYVRKKYKYFKNSLTVKEPKKFELNRFIYIQKEKLIFCKKLINH